MDFVIADILFSIIGFAYLFIRFRNIKRVQQVLVEEYDNSYSQAGRLITLQFLTGILLAMFIVLWFAMISGILKHNLKLF